MPRKTAKQVGADQVQSEILLSDSLSVVQEEKEEKVVPKQLPFGEVSRLSHGPSYLGSPLQVMKKHRWVMLFCIGLALGGAWLTMLGHVPLYTSVATLLLEPDPSQNTENRSRLAGNDYYQTQYAILQSRALAAQVIQEHGLEAEAYFAYQTRAAKVARSGLIDRFLASTRQFWSSRAIADDAPSEARPEQTSATEEVGTGGVDLVETYQSMLAIEPIQNTRVVTIAFQAPDPLLSAQLANAHAHAYLGQDWQLQTEWGAEAERIVLEAQIYLAHKGADGVLPTVVSNAKIEALAKDLNSREAEYARHLAASEQAGQAA
jgi:hypothetical protein